MNFEVLLTPAEVAQRAAFLFAEEVAANPRLVVALPTGRTPIEMYARLAESRRQGAFDLGQATTFNLDEVLLPRALPQTFFQFMMTHVWEPLGVAVDRRFIPNGESVDPLAECLRYEEALARAGGLDYAILVIGADGHIAYNLPHQTGARTHVVTLDPATLATLGGDLSGQVRGITMGVETILSAKKIVLLATGSAKAEAVRRLRDDPKSDQWPCTLFRDHPDLTVITDAGAGAQL